MSVRPSMWPRLAHLVESFNELQGDIQHFPDSGRYSATITAAEALADLYAAYRTASRLTFRAADHDKLTTAALGFMKAHDFTGTVDDLLPALDAWAGASLLMNDPVDEEELLALERRWLKTPRRD